MPAFTTRLFANILQATLPKLIMYFLLGSCLIGPTYATYSRIFRSSFVHLSFILRFLTKGQRRMNETSTKDPRIIPSSGVGKLRARSCELSVAGCTNRI